MEQTHSWEDNRFSASQKFPAYYGTHMFITAFLYIAPLSHQTFLYTPYI